MMFVIYFSVHIILTILCNATNADDTVLQSAGEKAAKEVFLNDDDVYNLSSSDFPNAYPPTNQNLIIKCDTGYSVAIAIESLDLDGNSGDFLVIKPGTTLNGDGEGKVYTHVLKNKRTLLVNSNNILISLQVFGNNAVRKKGFSLTYKRVEVAGETLPDPPTTPWPQPSDIDSVSLNVFVSGKTELEFETVVVQQQFKIAVSRMAIEYCKSEEVPLTKDITEENVQIHYLTQCPFSWPERDRCMKIKFSVPINIAENSTFSGYQLSTFHLDRMWQNLGNKYLEQYGMAIYSQNGDHSSLWIIILCSVIILFSVLLYLLTNILNCRSKKDKIDEYKHTNELILNPYEYTIPPMCSNDYGNKSNKKMPNYSSLFEPDQLDSDDEVNPSKTKNESHL